MNRAQSRRSAPDQDLQPREASRLRLLQHRPRMFRHMTNLRTIRPPHASASYLLITFFIFQVEFMQEAMDDGRKNDAENGDQSDAAEQCVTAGK